MLMYLHFSTVLKKRPDDIKEFAAGESSSIYLLPNISQIAIISSLIE